jgi:glycerophosphoryl diester phosphodiesterase
MQNIAHRGASVDALENTLEAFALAVEQGADMIETDLHLLRDGAVALYHDDEIGGFRLARSLAELPTPAACATLQETLDRAHRLKPSQSPSGTIRLSGSRSTRCAGVASRTTLFSASTLLLRGARGAARHARMGARPGNILARAGSVGAEAVHLHLLLATEERVREAHEAGYRVNVYTVDDPAAQRKLAGFGVDGIFTNLPAKLRGNLGG